METKEKKNKTDISIQLWPASREAINKLFFLKRHKKCSTVSMKCAERLIYGWVVQLEHKSNMAVKYDTAVSLHYCSWEVPSEGNVYGPRGNYVNHALKLDIFNCAFTDIMDSRMCVWVKSLCPLG